MIDIYSLLGFAILALAFTAYEIAGLTVPGWHTISFLAHGNALLRGVILAGFLLAPIWWWLHSGHAVAK